MVKYKNTLSLLLIVICLGFASSALADKPIVIKFSYVTANNTPKGKGALLLKKLVKEKLGGKVEVKLYPNGTLYNDNKGLQALQAGDIQLLAPGLDKLGQYSNQVKLFSLPFLFKGLSALSRFEHSDSGKKILESMQKYNIMGLAYWHNGMRQMSADRSLVVPLKARGLKLRVTSSDVLAAQVEAVHALPRQVSFDEVYQAMQTGVVDGQGGNSYANIYTKKWYEVQSDITETNNGVSDYMLVTNAKFWHNLPPAIRSQLDRILKRVTASVNEHSKKLNEHAKQEIVHAGGTKIHTLTTSQRAQWLKAEKPVYDQFRKQIGADLIAAAKKSNQDNGPTNSSS